MNVILIRNGYLPICIAPINRMGYISTLMQISKGKMTVEDLVKFIAKIEVQIQKDFMRLMHISFEAK